MKRQKTQGVKLSAGIILLVAIIPASAAFRPGGRAVDAGALFESKCAVCHGQDGRGTDFGKQKGAPDFTDAKWQQSRTDAQLQEAISAGKGKSMPAWKNKLSAEEIQALVGRVRGFGKKG